MHDLRTEHLHEPIGVGTRHPLFSWAVAHAQTSCRVQVFSGGERVWDSGRVEASVPALLYDGPPLASGSAYDWTVDSWSEGGRSAGAAAFETALIDSADWTADWVEPVQDPTTIERWSLLDWIRGERPASGPEERLRPTQLLRHAFTLPSAPVRARLHASARGVYTASVNGAAVGDEVLAPGFDSYAHRISAQVYDVTAQLRPGQNVLGVTLADGWWAGRIGISGSSAQFGDRTSAIWQLHVEFADGSTQVVASGDGVVSHAGPHRYADLFVGECLDARAVVEGWDAADFDASGWAPVVATDAGRDVLVPFTGEPVRRIAELPPRTIRAGGDAWIVDFGQVVAGRVRLRVRGVPEGRRVVVEHTEVLAADGSWFENIAGINKEQTDVFVSAGADATWEPEFTFHGFRYARISGVAELEADDLVAVVISSDLEATGDFVSSDARLNRLHENVVWSQRGNFLAVPTDCPQRERVGWTGDIQVFAPAATNNAHVLAFLRRWLANLRADQLADGGIPITSPRSPFDIEEAAQATGLGAITTAAGWSDAIALVPWTLWERYGDARVLAENYDAMLAWIEHQRTVAASALPDRFEGAAVPDDVRERQLLLYNTGAHFGDWLTPSTLAEGPFHLAILEAPRRTSELLAPMFQAQTLTIAARAAWVLGRETDAASLAARAAAVRRAFAAEYVDEHGDLPELLQGVYVLALAFDMVPAAVRGRTAARLAEFVEANGFRLDTGFLSVPHLLDVLWDTGRPDLARRLLWQSEQPSWLYEVDHGATTVWESWDAVAPDGTPRAVSMNHYAFGCVDDWLFRRVAGLRPTSPGWRTMTIEPDLASGLASARAHVGTPYGRAAVDWTVTGDRAVIRTVVPHGVDARLVAGGDSIRLPAGESTHEVALPPPG